MTNVIDIAKQIEQATGETGVHIKNPHPWTKIEISTAAFLKQVSEDDTYCVEVRCDREYLGGAYIFVLVLNDESCIPHCMIIERDSLGWLLFSFVDQIGCMVARGPILKCNIDLFEEVRGFAEINMKYLGGQSFNLKKYLASHP